MAKKSNYDDISFINSDEEKQLVNKIKDRYRASYLHKESIGLTEKLTRCQDYWAGEVNLPVDEDDPGSETNIIQPIIESQVADLVDGTMDIIVKGGPSEKPYIPDQRQRLKWVWYKNNMVEKLDEGERDRLNLGTVCWKVWYDFDALNGRGLTIIEPRSADSIFPDPKIKNVRNLSDGDFFIDVIPYPLSSLRRRFGKRAKLIKPEGNFVAYDPRIFGRNELTAATEVINDQALLFEYWEMAEDDDGDFALRRVYMAGDVILDDSDWTHKKKGKRKPFYKHNRYPFVMIPCYKRKGTLWGMSDTEQLIPIQDMINDLDDQIRMNARLMGNVQTVVGLAAGINIKKWTNKPGLKIPAKDHTAFQNVTPPTIPSYIQMRREKGFAESEIVSGRSDVTEGRRSGSLRAAQAIMAMQEAGNRRSNHKKLMLQTGFVEVMNLVDQCMREFMDFENSFDLEDKDGNNIPLWSRHSDIDNIPVKTRNENFDPTSDLPGTELYKNLLEPVTDETGQPIMDEMGNPNMQEMSKSAEFEYEISLGAGMPNNPSFIYQSTIELMRENIITREEARASLKKIMNWPIIDPNNPVGEFAGRNLSAEQLAMSNGMPMPTEQQGEIPPEQIPTGDPMQMILQALDSLPPEVVQELVAKLGGVSA